MLLKNIHLQGLYNQALYRNTQMQEEEQQQEKTHKDMQCWVQELQRTHHKCSATRAKNRLLLCRNSCCVAILNLDKGGNSSFTHLTLYTKHTHPNVVVYLASKYTKSMTV